MPLIALRYRFRQPFHVPADAAYRWCTDFGPEDGDLFSNTTRRSVHRLGEDALVMTDTTYPRGRPVRIRRLVRLSPEDRAWTNTHLDGPYRYSQFWYRIVPNGPRNCHLEFSGLHLENSRRGVTPREAAQRADERRRSDSGEWRRRLAPALERELA